MSCSYSQSCRVGRGRWCASVEFLAQALVVFFFGCILPDAVPMPVATFPCYTEEVSVPHRSDVYGALWFMQSHSQQKINAVSDLRIPIR